LLQVSNKLQHIQSLTVALGYRIVNNAHSQITHINRTLINEYAILAMAVEYLHVGLFWREDF
jgi:hypothetical protein